MRCVSYAEDRADDQRQLCQYAYVSLCHADGDRAVGDSEPLHFVPQGQIDGMGYEGVEGVGDDIAVAGGAVGFEDFGFRGCGRTTAGPPPSAKDDNKKQQQ
jgi:hypothetical protein